MGPNQQELNRLETKLGDLTLAPQPELPPTSPSSSKHENTTPSSNPETSDPPKEELGTKSNPNQDGEKDESFAPRLYQLEFYRRALEGNIIVVLETGVGKTLIAVMLIKEMVGRSLRNQGLNPGMDHQVAVFLVNTVHLVTQQARVIRANMPYNVKELQGGKCPAGHETEKWKELVTSHQVFVMTAQIFLNMLQRGYITMWNVSLLVFDECHHAQKGHAYNLIMQDFYHGMRGERPKVFGMTASPHSGNGQDFLTASRDLEEALDAKICTVQTQEELSSYVSRPKPIGVKYLTSPDNYQLDELISILRVECFKSKEIGMLCSEAKVVMSHLGPWCSLLLFRTELDRLVPSRFGPEGLLDSHNFIPNKLEFEQAYINRAISIYGQYKECIANSDPLDVCPSSLNKNHVSPKAQTLLSVLRNARKITNFCGIIFVDRRSVASALELLIRKTSGLDFLKCGRLVGHGGGKGGNSMQMSSTQQRRTINEFKDGVINLLIATNVAEEGLDIQPCNFVIRFDLSSNLISYIQSRGRARQKKSVYILMQEEGNVHEETLLEQLRQGEEDMNTWCRSDIEERSIQIFDQKYFRDAEPDSPYMPPEIYRVPETGATITLESAMHLLYSFCKLRSQDEYCDTFPYITFVSNRQQSFECTLTLPNICPTKLIFKESAPTKRTAGKLCAFKACVELHRIGEINDHLVPTKLEVVDLDSDSTQFNEDGVVRGEPFKTRHPYEANVPDFWQDDGSGWKEFYINVLDVRELEDCLPFAIITRKPLPQLNPLAMFYKGEGLHIQVISSQECTLSWCDSEIYALVDFTLQSFFSIFRKKLKGDIDTLMYLLAPLRSYPDDITIAWDFINWDIVRNAGRSAPLDLASPTDELIVCDTVDNLNRYYVKGVLSHLGPYSCIPDHDAGLQVGGEEEPLKAESDNESLGEEITFIDYYANKFNKQVTVTDQPVLEVERVTLVYNYLSTPSSYKKRQDLRANYLLPEFCCTYWLPASLLRSIMLIPSLMMRIDALLLVKEVKCNLGIDFVQDELLLEALTLKSANFAMDYERLELLGDSYLKFISTLDVFIRFPNKNEGELHHQRVRIIENRALCCAAKERSLPAYFVTQPFNRRSWCPPNITFENMSAAPVARSLSNKCLADVVEACLGASLLSAGRSQTLSCAKALGIPIGEIFCWEDFKNDHVKTPSAYLYEEYFDIFSIESTIGYTFRNLSLLLEAFTHGSYTRASTPSYQRLEFLGDAVLDHLVVSYLFQKYPDATPGELTEMKDACVNNTALAAIMETLDLHRHILHFSSKLMHAMEAFTDKLAPLREQWLITRDPLRSEYWFDTSPPKVISDVLEAILGAAFVDSGFDVDATSTIFMHIFQPFYDDHIAPNSVMVHPTIQFTRYIQQFGCQKYAFECDMLPNNEHDDRELPRPKSEEQFICTIRIHDHILATHSDPNTKLAKKHAAQSAMDRIRNDPNLLPVLCDCSAHHDDEMGGSDHEEEI